MADRSIRVTLKANVADFNAQIRSGSKSLEELAAKSDKTGKVAQTSLGRLAQSAQLQAQAWSTVSSGMLLVGGAGVAAVGAAVKVFADFDEAMSTVQADSHESAANMELLRAAAIQMGADTQYSATEAAQGIDALAKAGVSTKDILGGGLAGAMNLAAAGGMQVADAAETAATALKIFKLQGKDVGHVADLLAAGAGKAQGDVADLGMALKQGGVVASQTGLSIEETTGTLTAFAAAGLLSSDAGTSFKSMLQRLTPQSAEAQRKMDELGISAYDAQGNFIGMAKFAGNLQQSLAGLTTEQKNAAMSTIFGSDAVRAASVLYTEGEAGIQKWIDAVDDSGYAAETAAARTDNLKGDLERLGGSFETVFIQSGSGANEVLRELVQRVEDMVDWVGQLPEPVLNVGLGLAALGAGGLTVVGMAMKIIPQLVEMKTAMLDLNMISSTGATNLGKFAGAGMKVGGAAAGLTAAGFALGALINQVSPSKVKGLEDATAALIGLGDVDLDGLFAFKGPGSDFEDLGDALTNLTSDSLVMKMSRFQNWFAGFFGVSGNLSQQADQVDALDDALAQLVSGGHADQAASGFAKIKAVANEQGIDIERLNELFPEYNAALQDTENQQELTTDATDDGARASVAAASAYQEQVTSLSDLVDALNEAAGVAMSVDKAQEEWAKQTQENADAIQALTDHVDENGNAVAGLGAATADGGQSWDLYSKAGQLANETMLSTSQKAWDLIDALKNQGATEGELQASMQTSRDEFVSTATQMGLTQTAAEALADSYGLVPTSIHTVATLDDQASREIDQIKDKLASLPTAKTITVDVLQYYSSYGAQVYSASGNGAGARTDYSKHARGGALPGFGGGDILPSLLEPGEYIVNKNAARRNRGLLDAMNFGSVRGYQSGGSVGRVPVSMLAPSVSVAAPSFPSDGWSISGSLDVGGRLVELVDARITRNDRAMAGWR